MSDIPITGLVKAGFKARKAFRNWRNRVRARKGEAPKGISMLNGKKTYIGIATALVGLVLGWLGIGDEALSEQLVASASDLVTVAGALFAAYGRAKAKPVA